MCNDPSFYLFGSSYCKDLIRECYVAPPTSPAEALPFEDFAYIEGFGANLSAVTTGSEHVFDLYHLEYARFTYIGGSLDSAGLVGFSMNAYLGVARGFSLYDDIQQAYAGRSNSVAGGAGLPFDLVSTGGTIFYASPGSVVGVTAFIGVGASYNPSPVSGGFASSVYIMDDASIRRYHDPGQPPTLSWRLKFVGDIFTYDVVDWRVGAFSPLYLIGRAWAAGKVLTDGLY